MQIVFPDVLRLCSMQELRLSDDLGKQGFHPMTNPNVCAYCHDSNPVNYENGVAITYKSDNTLDVRVLLHKSCAAEWSKRFERSTPIQVSPVR